MRVVDGLEPIQVQVQHRQAALLAPGQRHLGHQAFHELGAVVQPGQAVVAGQVLDVLQVLVAFGHIGEGAQQAATRHRNAAYFDHAAVGALAHGERLDRAE